MYGFLQSAIGQIQHRATWFVDDFWRWTGNRWDWICRSTVHAATLQVGTARENLQNFCGAIASQPLNESSFVAWTQFGWFPDTRTWEKTPFLEMSPP